MAKNEIINMKDTSLGSTQSSEYEINSIALDDVFRDLLRSLRELIFKYSKNIDIELCLKWLKIFCKTSKNEKVARNCLCVLMYEQLMDSGYLQYPFTEKENCNRDLEQVLGDLDSITMSSLSENLTEGFRNFQTQQDLLPHMQTIADKPMVAKFHFQPDHEGERERSTLPDVKMPPYYKAKKPEVEKPYMPPEYAVQYEQPLEPNSHVTPAGQYERDAVQKMHSPPEHAVAYERPLESAFEMPPNNASEYKRAEVQQANSPPKHAANLQSDFHMPPNHAGERPFVRNSNIPPDHVKEYHTAKVPKSCTQPKQVDAYGRPPALANLHMPPDRAPQCDALKICQENETRRENLLLRKELEAVRLKLLEKDMENVNLKEIADRYQLENAGYDDALVDIKRMLLTAVNECLQQVDEEQMELPFKLLENIFRDFSSDLLFYSTVQNFDALFQMLQKKTISRKMLKEREEATENYKHKLQRARVKMRRSFEKHLRMVGWAQQLQLKLVKLKCFSALRQIVIDSQEQKDNNCNFMEMLKALEDKYNSVMAEIM